MKLLVKKGKTSKRVLVFIQDSSSTTGAGLTGLTSASSGLVCYRAREDDGNAGGTQLALSAGTRGTWSSGGFVEKDATNLPGIYELGLDNAGLATGSDTVVYVLKGATNMAPVTLEIQLVDFDPQNANLGLSNVSANVAQWNGAAVATPNVAGVPKVDVVDVNGAGVSSTNSIAANVTATGTAQAGAASTITLAAGSSATDNLFNGQTVQLTGGTGAGQVRVITGYVGSTKVATVDRAWQTNPDATTTYNVIATDAAAKTSALGVSANVTQWNGTNVAAPNVAGVPVVDVVDIKGSTVPNAGVVPIDLAQALNASPTAGTTGEALLRADHSVLHAGTAQAGASSSITLAAGASATNGQYNFQVVRLTGGTGAGQARVIQSYNGSTKVATLSRVWFANPDATTTYEVVPVDAPLVDSSGNVNAASVNTVNDKTGYSLAANDSPVVQSGTAQAGSTSTTIVLASGADSTHNDIYAGQVVKLTANTGVGQARVITAYTASTRTATVDRAWTVTPDGTTTYALLATDLPAVASGLILSDTAGTTTLLGRLTSTRAGNLDNLDAAVSTRVATSALPANFSSLAINGSGQITVGAYASGQDAASLVLNATASSFNTAGTIGHAINAAGTAADPWSTTLPGTYSAGMAGNIVGNLLANIWSNTGSPTRTLTAATNITSTGGTVHVDASGRTDVGLWLGGVPNALVSGRVDASAGAVADKTGYSLTQTFPANFAALLISAGGQITVGTVNDKTGYSLALPDSDVADSGTAQAGASGSITLRVAASSTTDTYKGAKVKITGGTGAGQTRTITGYAGGSRVATVDWPWVTPPDGTSTYAVLFDNSNALNSSLQVSTTASDPWATALPGAYGAGTAGALIGNMVSSVWANAARTLTAATNLTSTGGTITVDGNGRTQIQVGTAAGQLNTTAGAVQVGSYVAGQDPYTQVAKTVMTEGYAAKGAAPTLEQFAYMVLACAAPNKLGLSSTTETAYKLDGTTPALSWTLDSSTAPTTRNRST